MILVRSSFCYLWYGLPSPDAQLWTLFSSLYARFYYFADYRDVNFSHHY